jgi:maltokinase
MSELDLIAQWLPQQRWFGGKGRTIDAVSEVVSSPLDTDLRLVIVHVAYADGLSEDYQLLLGRRAHVEERLEHAVLGRVDGAQVYDAVHDPECLSVLLGHLAVGTELDQVSFIQDSVIDPDLAGRVLTAEQSNTSIVYGDALILKLFRRLQPGANPDIEITKALADAGSGHVARPLGWVDGHLSGERTTLALLQPFLKGGADGWAMATASVRDLFAEGDLHADEVGGDFAAESERLGGATGEVHLLMAQALPSGTADAAEIRSTAALLQSRLDAALSVVPELEGHVEGLREAYSRVAEWARPVAVQRIHGDFHLGQVLRTQDRWVLLDFEGEPARPLSERRALMSPLRDVAGMLRSFDYAAQHLLAQNPAAPQLAYRAAEWADRNRAAFCAGYAGAVGTDPRDEADLLRAFELDKAVYEVVYEARNRPTWLPVPLGSIARLVGTPA